jgi:glycosyltransferase involved in cell wall biosynthesis
MKFLFVSEYGHRPQGFGGLQCNTHELSLGLVERGHQAVVAARLTTSDFLGIRTRLLGKIVGKRKLHDRINGYPTYRRWSVMESLPDLVAEIRPDVAIAQVLNPVPLANRLASLSVPAIVYLHDVAWPLLGGDPRTLYKAKFVANSHFTATSFRESFGLDASVVRPFFRPDQYRGTGPINDNVTFINPHPLKGVEIALQLVARCPEIPFRFITSWWLSEEQKASLASDVKRYPNLTVEPQTRNMKQVYRRAKIVIMPSKCDEAWGRVVTEAQFSGTPVIASNRGGLPESVGPGGMLLDPDGDIENWVRAIRSLWFDNACYSEFSAAALAHSTRDEIDQDKQIEALLSDAHQAIQRNAKADGGLVGADGSGKAALYTGAMSAHSPSP